MKKSLLLSLLLGSASMGLHAQYTILEDMTSKIQNADFTADSPVTTTIYTYDYNMADAGAGAGGSDLFGQQAVTGWTAINLSDNIKVMESSSSPNRSDGANARAAGVFAYGNEGTGETFGGLGGNYNAPDADAEEGIEGQSLGLVAVWGASVIYTQDVTLPAGGYMLIVKAQNTAGSSEMNPSYNGFVASDGTEYLSSKKTWAVSQWETDTIFIRVKIETSGKIQLGYKSGNYGSGGAPHLFIDNVKLYSIDPTPLDKAEVDAAKEELLAIIEAGEEMGVDVSAAQAVYDNENATLAEVQAAIEKQKELNAAAQTDLSAYFIKNPHFTEDTPMPEDDGICTYDYDMPDPNGSNGRKVNYYGMLDVAGWVSSNPNSNARACGVFALGSNSFLGGAAFLPPTAMSDGSTEGNVLGFVGVWSAMSQYTQQVTLPKGKYTLEISYYNVGGTGTINKNLMGFVEDNGTEHLGTTTTFTVGKWLKETIKFEFDEPTSGYFTMGYTAANAGSGSMPHFFIDGIAIYYVGQLENPSLLGLESVVELANAAMEKNFYSELRKSLQEAIDAAEALIDANSSDEEANTAASDAINALLPEVNTSIAAYEKLDAFYQADGALAVAADKYENIASLSSRLGELQDEITDVLQDLNWTTEQIEEAIASLNTIIKEEIQKLFDAAVESGEEFDEDLDITPLFEQMAYTYSTSAVTGASVPDKEWQYGDASNFKTQYGTAEVWNQSPFTVSRTLKDMPAGKYTITTKAFYRTTDNQVNYDEYTPTSEPKAYVFAGNVKEGLTNVAQIASADLADLVGAVQVGDVYVPNSQQGAHEIFENDDYTSDIQKSVSTVLVDKGDLTFGIKADQLESNSWVIWYSFSISYNALTDEALVAELEGLQETLNSYVDGEKGAMSNYAEVKVSEALDKAGDALAEEDTDLLVEAIAEAKAAIAIADENIPAYEAYLTALDLLNVAYAEYENTAAADVKEQADALFATEPDDLDNAELKNLTEAINTIVAALKVPAGYEEATDENPFDFTVMIQNPSFEGENGEGSLDGWTYYQGSDTQAADNSNETYTTSNVDGNFVFNTWNGSAPEGGFYVSQVLKALPAGTYELQCILASDAGNIISLTAANGGADYVPANGADDEGNEIVAKTIGIEASIIFSIEEGEEVEIKASSANWFKADNFRLSYFGAESTNVPTDIASVEASSKVAPAAIYTISGAKVAGLQKGINIVKYADGTVKKVLVK